MTFEQFDEFTDNLTKQIKYIAVTKGKEYARSPERFDNFNRLAVTLDMDRKKILWVYLTKHLDAIQNYFKDGKVHSDEGIEGRVLDAIVYLFLLAGMMHEEDHHNHYAPRLEFSKKDKA